MDLLRYVFQGVGEGKPKDPPIQHFHVRKVEIHTQPDMEIMADGIALGQGHVQVGIKRHALAVMVGKPDSEGQVEDELKG